MNRRELEQAAISAADRCLKSKGYISVVDVLMETGKLSRQDYTDRNLLFGRPSVLSAPRVSCVYQGDPGGRAAGVNKRWGDVMAVRGSGTNTELFLNSKDGVYGAALKATSSAMTRFTNYWFNGSDGDGKIGRSVQFGATNSVFEKRYGLDLSLLAYI